MDEHATGNLHSMWGKWRTHEYGVDWRASAYAASYVYLMWGKWGTYEHTASYLYLMWGKRETNLLIMWRIRTQSIGVNF